MDKYSQFLFEETSPEHDSKVLNAAREVLLSKKQSLHVGFNLRWLATAFGVAGLLVVARQFKLSQNPGEEAVQSDFTKFALEFPDIQSEGFEVVEILAEDDLELIENLDLLEELEDV